MHKNCRCAWPLMLTTAALALSACKTDENAPQPVPTCVPSTENLNCTIVPGRERVDPVSPGHPIP